MIALTSKESGDTIRWLQGGRAFTITKPYEFMTELLPLFFKKTQFDSFVRRLKRWGFQRTPLSPDRSIFQHPFFQRDRPDLCIAIRCVENNPRKVEILTDKPQPVVHDSAKGNHVKKDVKSANFETVESVVNTPSPQDSALSNEEHEPYPKNHPIFRKTYCADAVKSTADAVEFTETVGTQCGDIPSENNFCDNANIIFSDKSLNDMKEHYPLAFISPSHLESAVVPHFPGFTIDTISSYARHSSAFLTDVSLERRPISESLAHQFDTYIHETRLRHFHLQRETKMSRDLLKMSGLLRS